MFLLTVFLLAGFSAKALSANPSPNIIYILADDLGYNDVSWNNPSVHTPNLEALASDGLILNHNYVQTNCGPSRNALMTGHYPYLTGGQSVSLATLEPLGVPTMFKFLPAYLKDLGYATHGVGKWHLGFCHPDYLPSNRGFDTYKGFWNGGGRHFNHSLSADPRFQNTSGYDFHINEKIDFSSFGISTSEIIADRVNEIVYKHVGVNKTSEQSPLSNYSASNPFFIYASFQDPHMPLEIEEKYTNLYPDEQDPIRKRFLGMVSRLDAAVGRIVADLESISYRAEEEGAFRTLLEDTIIIFSSDNGGWSDDGLAYWGGSNLPLRGSKVDLLEGGTRVPAFIWNSGRKGITDELFHITDWLPTIYTGIAGGDKGDLPDTLSGFNQIDLLSTPDGQSLRDEVLYDITNFENTNFTFIFGDVVEVPVLVFSGASGSALRFEDWKLIRGCHTFVGCVQNYGEVTDPNSILLYNLAEDPNETTDLSEDPAYADILAILMERLQFHIDRAVQPMRAPEEEAGSPTNTDPQVYFTGWCESKYSPE